MKNPKMNNNKEEIASKKMKLNNSGLNSLAEMEDSSLTPTKSRFGRSHKPKLLGDFLSTDKKVSAVLKVSPGNQIKYFMEFGKCKSPKKEKSPKKSPVKSSPKAVKRVLVNQPILPPVEIKVEPNELEPVPGCEWMVGDLAWARVGHHPFWPCIVNIDPSLGIFTRIRMFSRSLVPLRRLHVQFFGDNGRRSWISSAAVMNYTGKEAFENLAKSILSGMKRKDPRQVSALIVKPQMKSAWEAAVSEAESLINSSREERVLYFRKLYPVHLLPVRRISLSDNETDEFGFTDNQKKQSPGAKKRGRKRKAETTVAPAPAAKQIKLEKESESELDNEEKIDVPTPKSSKKLSILERVRLSEKSSPEESRSPSSRIKRKREEEAEKKKLEKELRRKIEREKNEEIQKKTRVSSKKEDSVVESKRTKSGGSKEEIKKKKKKANKKFGAGFQAFSNKHFDRVLDEHPELKEGDVEKYLEKMWEDMDEQQKRRYRPRVNNGASEDEMEASETEASDLNLEEPASSASDKSSSPPPLAVATTRSGVGKRGWSLFNGARPINVCQICEKPGDTLRCKGPCSGTYHLECALNPLQMSARRQELQKIKSKNIPIKKDKKGRKKCTTSLDESESNSDSKYINEEDENLVNGSTNEEVGIVSSEEGNNAKNSIVKKEEQDTDAPEVSNEENNSKVDETKEEKTEKPKAKKSSAKGSKESNDSGEEVDGQAEFRCPDCSENRVQPCFFCGLEEKNGDNKRIRCHIAHCGKVYHAECLKAWPQTSWTTGSKRGSQIKAEVMTCPQHSCHTCVSDNPAVMKARFQNDKMVRCLRCPTSYHYGNYCLPAGSEILTSRQIICPKHYRPQRKGTHHVNAAWCFICATGGSLICCDLCPTAFHADCLKISPPEGGYICEDCETGRFPLYGEVVWVKLGSYRWWPAQILFPHQIPDNILNLAHSRGEFAVRFFGSHDYYWLNRGRVFLYHEGDSGKGSSKHSQTDQVFLRAVQEAGEAYQKLKNEKSLRDAETRPGLKPPFYIKIKTNKPIGAVRMMEANVSSMTPCECDPDSPNPCAPDSDCLNRILMVECNPLICPAGDQCKNQLFEKRQYPPLMPYRTEGRGWGLKTLVDLKKGDFVIEYVGEMIDEEEYQKRLKKMHQSNDENYYFLTIDKDRMLDAGPKGNVARFMNHSCQPNCETQKWTVNGDTRVGLFTLCDVPADTELVFNYNLESIGTDKKPCMCGAPNCSGFIGVKVSKNNNVEEEKKTVQVKKNLSKKLKATKVSASDDVCFMCGEGGELLLCDSKACPKGYHLSCLKRTKSPQGKWLCPWHQCNICSKGRVKRCTYCVNSYCPNHSEGNIRLDESKGLVCSKHDDKAELKDDVNEVKKLPTEQLGVEVDSLMEVDEASNEDEQNEFESETVPSEDQVPLSSSSPIPPEKIDVDDGNNKMNVESKPTVVGNKSTEVVSNEEAKTNSSEDLTELTVTKPTREYRNKRLKSSSDVVNGVSRTFSTSRRLRPVSVDTPIGIASKSSKTTQDTITGASSVSSNTKKTDEVVTPVDVPDQDQTKSSVQERMDTNNDLDVKKDTNKDSKKSKITCHGKDDSDYNAVTEDDGTSSSNSCGIDSKSIEEVKIDENLSSEKQIEEKVTGVNKDQLQETKTKVQKNPELDNSNDIKEKIDFEHKELEDNVKFKDESLDISGSNQVNNVEIVGYEIEKKDLKQTRDAIQEKSTTGNNKTEVNTAEDNEIKEIEDTNIVTDQVSENTSESKKTDVLTREERTDAQSDSGSVKVVGEVTDTLNNGQTKTEPSTVIEPTRPENQLEEDLEKEIKSDSTENTVEVGSSVSSRLEQNELLLQDEQLIVEIADEDKKMSEVAEKGGCGEQTKEEKDASENLEIKDEGKLAELNKSLEMEKESETKCPKTDAPSSDITADVNSIEIIEDDNADVSYLTVPVKEVDIIEEGQNNAKIGDINSEIKNLKTEEVTNQTVDCPKIIIDPIVNKDNLLTEQNGTECSVSDVTLNKDLVTCDTDKDVVVNGSCTVNSSPVSV